jgi:hypothetical protein
LLEELTAFPDEIGRLAFGWGEDEDGGVREEVSAVDGFEGGDGGLTVLAGAVEDAEAGE